jgi:hypothetical protein
MVMMKTQLVPRLLLGSLTSALAFLALSGAALGATTVPLIHNFLPRSGVVGTVITITGTNLSGTTALTVDGLQASFKVRSKTRITVTVPSNALTGKLSITTPHGIAMSKGDISIVPYATAGSGTLTAPVTSVGPVETGDVIPFTYTAATGGLSAGVLQITVPTGWSPPATTAGVGCTASSAGTVAVNGQTITVSGLTIAAAGTVTVTYGASTGGSCTNGDGAVTGSTPGAATFATKEASTANGTLTAIAASPSITVT